jgi:hypothetical protein
MYIHDEARLNLAKNVMYYYFWRFSPIFGAKIGDFLLKNNVMIIFSVKMTVALVKKPILCHIFQRKYIFKSQHIDPRSDMYIGEPCVGMEALSAFSLFEQVKSEKTRSAAAPLSQP